MSEVYNKIYKLLGPSPFPHTNQHMMGPLGLVSPHPGVSYLFHDGSHTDGDGSLWGIANGNQLTNVANVGGLMSPPATWTPALGETMLNIDKKFKVRLSNFVSAN